MKGRIVAAILLLAIGLAWLLEIQGRTIFPGGWSVWWPAILIVVGLAQMAVAPRNWRGGAVLVLIGAVFQAWTLGYLSDDIWVYAAPVALIVIAILILLPPWRTRTPAAAAGAPWREGPPGKIGPEDVAVFSGHRLDAQGEYKGGELTAVFGNLDADLRQARLPPEGARMKATSVFGGVHIRVPADWRVEVHGTPVLGRTANLTVTRPDGPKLDIEAVAVFGNVEVTNG